MGLGGGDGIGVHAEDFHAGEPLLELLLDPLGADADEVEAAAARRTGRGQLF